MPKTVAEAQCGQSQRFFPFSLQHKAQSKGSKALLSSLIRSEPLASSWYGTARIDFYSCVPKS